MLKHDRGKQREKEKSVETFLDILLRDKGEQECVHNQLHIGHTIHDMHYHTILKI